MDALAFTSSNFVRSKRHIIEPRNWRKMGAISISKETESPILSFPFGGSLSRNSLCQCAESKHHQVCRPQHFQTRDMKTVYDFTKPLRAIYTDTGHRGAYQPD